MRVGTNLPPCMKVLNRKAYEWRRDHRAEVLAQLKLYLEKGGGAAPRRASRTPRAG